MKIVVLTNQGSLVGKKILDGFILNNIETSAVAVIQQPFKYYWKQFKSVQRRVGLFDTIYFSIKRTINIEMKRGSVDYKEIGVPILYSRGTNSKETLEVMKTLSPDLLILGQTGIVKKELLDIPFIGTLNAHPGILPSYRGIDCAKWAIFNNEFDKVGATVHWVDMGVDTGNIIIKEFYNFLGNETIETLDKNLYDLCVSLLLKVIYLIQKGDIPVGDAQIQDEGTQYYKMSRKNENITEKKLKEFLESKKVKVNLKG